MISFLVAVALLVLGYFLYGSRVAHNFRPDDRPTPAVAINDGVDFVPMKEWKIFLIQLLNIAGTGPIFGALGGALFGPIVYLWIIFGCIFAGAVHDYYCGMISMRHNGESVSELTGLYLGNKMRLVMRVFSVVLLVMCGVVFTTGPAELLAMLTPEFLNKNVWLWIILIYYFFATFLPVDKIMGFLYPIFGFCLIAMAFGVGGSMLFSGHFTMPEVWNHFGNEHASGTPVWPFMFITVACGAVSGFHATQSPMMARCCTSERQGRRIFYGAMIAEGIIALIWAAAGVTCYESSQALLEAGGGCSAVVYAICQTTTGKIGSALALIGVIVCPISSGDTAYRSARLTLSDWFKINQSRIKNRIFLTAPLLIAGAVICQLDYSIVWRYFSWANQTLAMITLWMVSVYLYREGKKYINSLIPAVFMSAVTFSYFMSAPECMGLFWNAIGVSEAVFRPMGYAFGLLFAFLLLGLFFYKEKRKKKFPT